jgi:hypothetical protein
MLVMSRRQRSNPVSAGWTSGRGILLQSHVIGGGNSQCEIIPVSIDHSAVSMNAVISNDIPAAAVKARMNANRPSKRNRVEIA